VESDGAQRAPPGELLAGFRENWGAGGRDFKESLRKMLQDIETRAQSSLKGDLWDPDFALYPADYGAQTPAQVKCLVAACRSQGVQITHQAQVGPRAKVVVHLWHEVQDSANEDVAVLEMGNMYATLQNPASNY